MPITSLHGLTQAQFDVQLRDLIAQLEGNRTLPYFDTANPPRITIGIGFNIDIPANLTAVLDEMQLSAAERTAIATAMAPQSAPMNQIRAMASLTQPQRDLRDQALRTYLDGVLGRQFIMTNPQIDAVFTDLAQTHVTAVQALGVGLSSELVALASLDFNGLVGGGLTFMIPGRVTPDHERH